MKKYGIEIKWGITFFVAILLWMFIEKLAGLHDEYIEHHAFYTYFFVLPAIAIYALALLEKRKKFYNGYMTWREGFSAGMIMTMVVVILSPIGQLIIHNIITPDYFVNVIEYTVANEIVSREDAENYFNLRSYLIQSIVSALMMGAVTSAVVALFVRNKRSVHSISNSE